MKASLVVSAVLHGLVLSWALISLGAPDTLEVADVEALPVDIVPVESITQIQKGEKEAPASEIAAPKPTSRPEPVKDAEIVGDNTVDLETPPAPDSRPKPVEAAAPPKASENPAPQAEEETPPKPVVEEAPAPEPAPATEVAALPEPSQPVEPDPAPEESQAADESTPTEETPQPSAPEPDDAPEFASLPEAGPAPSARPKPPQAQTAKTPERKEPDTPVEVAKKPDRPEDDAQKEPAKASSAKKSDFNEDKIAALLNREDSSGGGAKRSRKEASLGGNKTTLGDKLTQSEMDALRGQIQKNWNIIPGMADGQNVRITVTMRLDRSGAIIGRPQVRATGGSDAVRSTLSGSARRAVQISSPFQGLPRDKYDAWSQVVVNFDPSQMY